MLPFSGTIDDHDHGDDDGEWTPATTMELAGLFLTAFLCCAVFAATVAYLKR